MTASTHPVHVPNTTTPPVYMGTRGDRIVLTTDDADATTGDTIHVRSDELLALARLLDDPPSDAGTVRFVTRPGDSRRGPRSLYVTPLPLTTDVAIRLTGPNYSVFASIPIPAAARDPVVATLRRAVSAAAE